MWNDLLSYLSAIWGNARLLLTAGPYFADAVIKRLLPRFHNWINTKFSEPARRRVEIAVFFCGIFIATFLAWRDQHEIVRDLEASKAQLKDELEKRSGDKDNRPTEDLVASFVMDNSLNMTNDLNEIRVVFYNNGTKPSVIDSVSLIINYFDDEHNDVNARNDICNDPVITEFASLFESGMSIVPHVVTNLDKEQKVSLNYYKADRYIIDGSITGPPIIVDAGKSRVLTASFKVDRSKINGNNAVVWCPTVRLFDKDGHAFLTVCKGSMVALLKNGSTSGPYALPPVRLLPPPPNNTTSQYACRPE
jgi:hypothetical protein